MQTCRIEMRLYVHGVPWDWAHELSTRVAYFVGWLGVIEMRPLQPTAGR